MTLAEKILALRTERGMSQDETQSANQPPGRYAGIGVQNQTAQRHGQPTRNEPGVLPPTWTRSSGWPTCSA